MEFMIFMMRPKSHSYNSKSHINYIKNYIYEYNTNNKEGYAKDSIYALRMPVIIQSDHTVWELGSLYLQYLMIEKSLGQSSLESTASDLLDFLKFMEHSGLEILHLPNEKHERVTYRYKASLAQRIRQSRIKPSTANVRINKVMRLYDFCIANQLFHRDSLRNYPYSIIKYRYLVPLDYGGTFEKEIVSSDLAFRVPKRQVSADEIMDGGALHPLNEIEQNLVKQYLRDKASREFQLICYLALFSGARIQTVCTLRVFNIKNLKKNNPDSFDDAYALKVGSNTVVDTKNGTNLTLKIPSWLADELLAYTNSLAWKERAKLSYYGISDQNYLFLTSRGNAYYTSLKEIEDRRISNSLHGFKQSRGLSVRIHINQMLKKLNEEEIRVNPFTFHDLRATFGLNTLKLMIHCGFSNDHAILYLKERMGHRYIHTTMRYLEYASFTSNVVDANTSFSEALNQYNSR